MTIMQQPSEKTFPTEVLNPPLFDNDDETSIISSGTATRRRESVMSQQLTGNFESLKKRARCSAEDDAARELALETALLVREEVKRMKDSIAELEALLEQQGEDQLHDNNSSSSSNETIGIRPVQERVLFPLLPEVVLVPEEDKNCNADFTFDE